MSKIIHYDSIGKAIRKVIRDIEILDESIHDDLLEWVSEALDMLRTTGQMIPHEKKLEVKNNRAKIPCGVESIQAVGHRGNRVRYGERIGSYISWSDSLPPESYYEYWVSQPPTLVPNEYHQIGIPYISKMIDSLKIVTTKAQVYEDHFYYIRDGYIETNLPDGEITIHYLGVPLDDDGFPRVPKNAFLYEAVINYVTYKINRRKGLGSWRVDKQEWETSFAVAQANIEFPSPEKMQSLLNKTLVILKPEYYQSFEL